METTSVLVVGLRPETSLALPSTIDRMNGFRTVLEANPRHAEVMLLSRQVGLVVLDAGSFPRGQAEHLIHQASLSQPPVSVVIVGANSDLEGH